MTSSCDLKNTSFCIYQKRHFWRGFWKPHLYRAFLNLVRVDFLALKHSFDFDEFKIFSQKFRKKWFQSKFQTYKNLKFLIKMAMLWAVMQVDLLDKFFDDSSYRLTHCSNVCWPIVFENFEENFEMQNWNHFLQNYQNSNSSRDAVRQL